MKITDQMTGRALSIIYVPGDNQLITPQVMVDRVRRALEAALEDVPEPTGEVCDGEHGGPCPAWHDGLPIWVRELSARWEEEAVRLVRQGGGAGHAMVRCAAELRAFASDATP